MLDRLSDTSNVKLSRYLIILSTCSLHFAYIVNYEVNIKILT